MPSTPSFSTASRSPSTARTTSACCGCCGTCSGSRGRSTVAGSPSARPAPATSTARPSTRARCSVSNIKPTDEIVTIEGLPATVGKDLHPMQQALARLRRRPVRLLPARADHGGGGARQRHQVTRAGRSPTTTSIRSATCAVAGPTRAFARRSPPQLAACSAWRDVGSARRTSRSRGCRSVRGARLSGSRATPGSR